MELRRSPDEDIRKKGVDIRQAEEGIRVSARGIKAAGKGGMRAGKAAGRIAEAGIAEGKDLIRSKDVRRQLKMLTAEQRRQWHSYSFRKQNLILKKSERMAHKAQERKTSLKRPPAKMIAYQLNRLAKGNRISNMSGTGERWQVEVPKGNTADEMRRNMKRGDMETVTYYAGSISEGTRRASKYEGKLRRAIKEEKRENRNAFGKAVTSVINKEMKKEEHFRQMQKEDCISQMEFESMGASQVLALTSMPLRARINYAIAKLEKRFLRAAGKAFMNFVLPAASPLLALIMIFMVLLSLIGGASKTGEGAYGGSGGQRIVQVAVGEVGNTGGQPYWSFMGFQGRVPWCASFVSWCANECGYIESGVIPQSASCDPFRSYYKAKELWYDGQAHGGNYTPKAGDLILFQWSGNAAAILDHVGIVKSSDGSTVYTVEGNSGDAVRENSYLLSDVNIIGYCCPEYPEPELTGGSHAEMIFNYLMEQGFSKAASSAVVANLYAEGGQTPDGDINIHSTEAGGAGEGVGMVQWSFGRKTAFLQYCEERGQPWPDTGLDVQIDYMLKEFFSNQWIWSSIGAEYGSQCNITKEAFMQCDDVELATRAWCAKFERCHYQHSNLESVRIPRARAFYEGH